jgi:hypothetical protein
MSQLDTFTVRDYDTGDGKDIRTTLVNPTSPDVDVHVPHHISEVAPVENRVSGSGSTTGTSTTAVAGMGPVSGKRNYVSAVQVANKGATAVLVTLQDGSGGTALAYIYCPAGQTVPVVYPSPLRTTANTGLYFQADGTTTTLYISAQGYTE